MQPPKSVPCPKCKGILIRQVINTSLTDRPTWKTYYNHRPVTDCWWWLSEKEAMKRYTKLQGEDMQLNVILQGNVLDVLRGLAKKGKRFKCIITSSPYLGLRFYGTDLQVWDGKPGCKHKWQLKVKNQHSGRGDGQKSGKYSEQEDYPDIKTKQARCTKCQAWMGELGQEPTRGMFLEHLWQICDLLMQVLEDDGTLWFNIADKRDEDGSLMNVPHMFAEGLRARGWIWLDDTVWFKRSVLPQSDPTVFSPDHEYVFHFAKKDAPTFYANGKLGIMQREKPPGVEDGKEGRDWYWKERENEPKTKNNKKLVDGKWYVKVSLWKPYTYFHETQYEPYSESSLKQINQVYNGKSKKHALAQSTLDDHTADGVQNPSDVKRRIIASMQKSMPAFGGTKHKGYGNGTYSGKEWTPNMAGGGSNIRCESGYSNSKDELVGNDPKYGRFMRNTWIDLPPDELPSDVWDIIPARFAEAHFATFPVDLVLRCLRTSCPRQVCTKCGLGWRKMYSEERKATRPGKNTGKGKSGTGADPNAGLHNSELSRKRETIIRREVGIMKCTCNAPTRPGAVLDPFMGSGTTAIAAIMLALWWLGIELSAEFIKLAMKRLEPYIKQSKLESE